MFGYVQIKNLHIVELGKNKSYFDDESYDTKYYFENKNKFTAAKYMSDTHTYKCIFTKNEIEDYYYLRYDGDCCYSKYSPAELLDLFCDEKYIRFGLVKKKRVLNLIKKLNGYSNEDKKVKTYTDNVIPFRKK